MPVYHFGKDGKTQVTVTYERAWQNIAVLYQGQEVGSIEDGQTLITRQSFALPDDSTLDLQFVQVGKEMVLHVVKDAETLVWLDEKFMQPVRVTSRLLHYIGIVLILISPFALLGVLPPNSNFSLALTGAMALVIGIVSIVCARRIASQFSEQAILWAIGLYVALAAILIVSRNEFTTFGAVLTAGFIIMLFWAHRAVQALNQL